VDSDSLIELGPTRSRLNLTAESRAELALGAVAVGVLAFVVAMLVTVFVKAWPSFAHNGYIKWFFPGGDTEAQLKAIVNSPPDPAHYTYHLRAWPLLWDTILTTGIAVALALVLSLFSAIFIVEFAPRAIKGVLEPVVRLLAAVPSVIFGLIGILIVVPWINAHLISQGRKQSVAYVVQLNGAGLLVASLILMVMIVPIMVAITVNALAAVPGSWTEGSAALGVNRWRTMWRVSVRTARPAIIAGTVLATARALGEAIMLALVGGGRVFAPNLLDGRTALFEPVRPLAATIIAYKDNLSVVPMLQTLYAMAAVVLVSTAMLSLAAWTVKQPLKRYGIRT
jgi:ABC-type phosphate transport system permease subunit